MSEDKTPLSYEPWDLLLYMTKEQRTRVAFYLGQVLEGTGWGTVSITCKNGHVHTVQMTVEEKLPTPRVQ